MSLEKRKQVVALIKSIAGKNRYSRAANLRGRVFEVPGYGDCSSTVRACWKRAAGIDIGSYTVAQITNKGLVPVCLPDSKGQPNEALMLPGDLLYFEGKDTSRPYSVGHVEMYTGTNTLYGHGSGKGPRKTAMRAYCASRKLIKVLRVPLPGDEAPKKYKLGERELDVGIRGEDVEELQRVLIGLGYSVGSYGADGDFGPVTKGAVAAFQKEANLSIVRTGTYGIKTHRALIKAQNALSDPGEEETPPAGVPYPAGFIITTGDVNLRAAPAAGNTPILGVISQGTELRVLVSDSGEVVRVQGWYGVHRPEGVAWISGKYAQELKYV